MHLTESELAAVTHGELSALPKGASTHLESCRECSIRLEALRSADREVGDLLRDLDHPASRLRGATFLADLQRRRRRIGAIAAALAVFVAGAAAALPNSPLHHVLLRALGRTGPTYSPPSERPGDSARPQPGAGVAFIPASSLDVRFRNPRAGGVVRIVFVDGQQMSAAAEGDAAFSIHQSQLEVNDRGRAMTFTLEIPRSLAYVRVRVDNATIFEKRGSVISGSHPMDQSGAYVFELAGPSVGHVPTVK